MAVKILLKRQFPEEKTGALKELIDQLRSSATGQPGYISGETLRRIDQPGEFLVVSKWKSRMDWDRWFEGEERTTLQKKIDDLLGSPTVYEIYEYE
jgi:heme-degrading monooxygenase HmoA